MCHVYKYEVFVDFEKSVVILNITTRWRKSKLFLEHAVLSSMMGHFSPSWHTTDSFSLSGDEGEDAEKSQDSAAKGKEAQADGTWGVLDSDDLPFCSPWSLMGTAPAREAARSSTATLLLSRSLALATMARNLFCPQLCITFFHKPFFFPCRFEIWCEMLIAQTTEIRR